MTEHQLHAISSLLLVDVDLAVTSSFIAVFTALHACGRLDRLVIDEAHLILTAAHYRENLGLLGVLRRVGCPILCLTATLPPVGERELKQSLHFTQTEMLRVSSDRANLQYSIQVLSVDPNDRNHQDSGDEALLRAAVQICRDDIQQWIREAGSARPTARSICYVREKSLGSRLATKLHAEFYHAGLDVLERDRVWAAWSDGQASPVLVASSAFGVGVDYASVRRVLHLDAPYGMCDYGQESGRAGRDGLHAACTILLPTRWSVTWNTGYRSDFLTEDCKQMTRYLQNRQCLRLLLTIYLDGWIDGRLGVACSAGQTRCSFCTRAAEKAAEKVVITASRSGAMKSLPAAASSSKADSVVSTPTAATSNIADEVAFSARSETVDVDHETSDSDYGSDPDQELVFMQSSGGAQDMQSSGDAQNMQSLGDA